MCPLAAVAALQPGGPGGSGTALPHIAVSDEASAFAPFGKLTAEDVGGLLWASVTAGCKNSWQEVCS